MSALDAENFRPDNTTWEREYGEPVNVADVAGPTNLPKFVPDRLPITAVIAIITGYVSLGIVLTGMVLLGGVG